MWIQVPLLLHSQEVKNESNKLSLQRGSRCFHKDKDVNNQRQGESEGREREINKVSEIAQKWSFSKVLEIEDPEVVQIN